MYLIYLGIITKLYIIFYSRIHDKSNCLCFLSIFRLYKILVPLLKVQSFNLRDKGKSRLSDTKANNLNMCFHKSTLLQLYQIELSSNSEHIIKVLVIRSIFVKEYLKRAQSVLPSDCFFACENVYK